MYKGKFLAAIIAAGGMGTRFGVEPYIEKPKQFMDIGGKKMLIAAAVPFLNYGFTDEIVFVVPMGFGKYTCERIVREMGGVWAHAYSGAQELRVSVENRDVLIRVAYGGQDRGESVRAGLDAVRDDFAAGGIVLIHDAARPYVSEKLIARVTEAAYEHGAAVPVTGVNDTAYIIDDGGFAAGVPDRLRLRGAQTPQGFDLDLIERAYERASEVGLRFTDDGTPVYAGGGRVALVEGELSNIKITLPEDLPAVEPGRAVDRGFRIGVGFDAHRFEEGRALILGGVEIPFEKGLDGHSDADVIVHALMDAILGALHEGDIGTLFPDSDPVYAGVSSMELLNGVVSLMGYRGYVVINADIVLVAEKPRIAPYREVIEQKLAIALGTARENVSLKGTTTEKLGFTGREDGIAAEAVVLLKSKKS